MGGCLSCDGKVSGDHFVRTSLGDRSVRKECAKCVPTVLTRRSVRNFAVEPPVTVGLSFCPAAFHDVSYVSVFSAMSSPHETVVGRW